MARLMTCTRWWTRTGCRTTTADPNTFATAVFPNCPDKLFQFHHQSFNYYASFAPGTAAARPSGQHRL
jgi:phospholipase C